MISVRDMTSRDYVDVREHLTQCWHDAYAHLMQPSDFANMLASLNDPNLGLIAPDALALIALDNQDNRVVGTAIAAERHGVGYVWGMYVAPGKKRNGIGRTLINAVLARLPSANQLSVVVLKASSDAMALYKAQGFASVQDSAHELAPGRTERATLLVLNRSSAPH
ncbi:MAG: GNAT family N-acetyltransferase [Pseudomonadota bacterium]